MVASRYFKSAVIAAAVLAMAGALGRASAQSAGSCVSAEAAASDGVQIRGVLAAYNAALNSGSTASLAASYAEDGISWLPTAPRLLAMPQFAKPTTTCFANLNSTLSLISPRFMWWPLAGRLSDESAGTTLRIIRPARQAPKPIRSSSSSVKAMTVSGGLPVTAFRRSTLRARERRWTRIGVAGRNASNELPPRRSLSPPCGIKKFGASLS